MKLNEIAPGPIVKVGRLIIDSPGASGGPGSYQDVEVCFADGWVYVEVKEEDGEGSANVYPAHRVKLAFNVQPTKQEPKRARGSAHFV
ncbi:hypothetical protein [Klenkia brasiliensis]|uniref:Uncharacterized protein n=1 Tax=Klenkia brasiliensis TaxID=333142 RepID=A0A1G7YGC7_9ACTN|nr:hypothetical protein [Klenkia brasiliensis]SDG95662.1 hypothetical protein SAMN05660324_3952 [Klenkia brasiliensis]